MAEGLVYSIISAFLLLNQILGIVGDKLDNISSSRLSIPFDVGGQTIIDNGVTRKLTPPYQPDSLKYSSNHKRKDSSRKTFLILKPIPLKLTHKSTFTTGPVDEATFRRLERQNLPTRSRDDEPKRNEISSDVFPLSDRQFQRRRIQSSSYDEHQNRLTSSGQNRLTNSGQNRPANSGYKLTSNLPPVASFRGFIATPGKSIQKISGTPLQYFERTIFKDKNIDLGGLQLPLSSSSSMTVIPGVVRSFPLVIKNQNLNSHSSYDNAVSGSNQLPSVIPFSDNAITNQISNSIFRNFRQLSQNTLPRGDNIRFARNLKSQNSKINSVNNKQKKVKIIIYSKTPSKKQPPTFWNKILQMIPQLSKSKRLPPALSNVTPKHSGRVNHFVERFQAESKSQPAITQVLSPPNIISHTDQHTSVIDGNTSTLLPKDSQAKGGGSFSDTGSAITGANSSPLLTWANFSDKYNVDKD